MSDEKKDHGREAELERAVVRLMGTISIWRMWHTGEIEMPPNLIDATNESVEAARVALGQSSLGRTV